MRKIIFSLVAVTILYVTTWFVSIFVIPPLGALPEGKTLIIVRGKGMNFVDSADSMCLRMQGGVNLFCRGLILAEMSKVQIIVRLPYSEFLDSIATDGKKFTK